MRHAPDMARKLRLQYLGAIYHLMSRGDRREPVFLEDADRALFVSMPVSALTIDTIDTND
jgi:hypothetical protein